MFLEIDQLSKMFDEKNGVRDIRLNVERGEFITLLGPSGCGKTTILNLLGGFLLPDEGTILLDGEAIENLPPERRNVSTVFQNYALFPHYSVLENVAYGIRHFRKLPKKEALRSAEEYLATVGLEGYGDRAIHQLSGGQQQRVALARGLATNPKLLLLDEPLSNLDANLRTRMRGEIKELQRKFDITMLFVTHDQSEALTMSDRIVVMDRGKIVQVGTPEEIYRQPVNRYVASFVGKANFLREGEATFLVRPEDVEPILSANGKYTVTSRIFFGTHSEVFAERGEERLELHVFGEERDRFVPGDRIDLKIHRKLEMPRE